MNWEKGKTDFFLITGAKHLDPITVVLFDCGKGRGKLIVECYGKAWTTYWSAMGDCTLQQFVIDSHNDYLLRRMLPVLFQTDFEAINRAAEEKGIDLYVGSDVDVAMAAEDMEQIYGPDWRHEVPTTDGPDSDYLSRILDAVKAAFSEQMKQPRP